MVQLAFCNRLEPNHVQERISDTRIPQFRGHNSKRAERLLSPAFSPLAACPLPATSRVAKFARRLPLTLPSFGNQIAILKAVIRLLWFAQW
jgi:hypothetical protein